MKQLKVLESDLVSEWCSKDGDPLDANDRKLLERFIDKYHRDKSKVTVYRGTSKVSMYGVDLDNITELSQKLFMLGVKANRYALFDDWKFGINDVSDDVFAKLFDCLHEIFTSSAEPEGYPSRKKFLQENTGIKEFFGSPDNKVRFLEKIGGLACKADVKDYYVALLHAFDAGRQFPACYMISTSTNYEAAQRFLKVKKANSKKGRKANSKKGILIISWVLSSVKDRVLKYQDLNECNKQIEGLDLPVYKSSPFPKQKEMCIKAIIPPQFVLGYIHAGKKIFIPNPHLIKEMRSLPPLSDEGSGSADREDVYREIIESECIGHIITEGISIDQSTFEEILRKSKFKRYGSIGTDGEYKEPKRNPK